MKPLSEKEAKKVLTINYDRFFNDEKLNMVELMRAIGVLIGRVEKFDDDIDGCPA